MTLKGNKANAVFYGVITKPNILTSLTGWIKKKIIVSFSSLLKCYTPPFHAACLSHRTSVCLSTWVLTEHLLRAVEVEKVFTLCASMQNQCEEILVQLLLPNSEIELYMVWNVFFHLDRFILCLYYLYSFSSNLFLHPECICVLVCVSVSNVAGRLKPADTGTLLPALNYLYCSLSLSPAHCTDRGDLHPPSLTNHFTLLSPARLGFTPPVFTDRHEGRKPSAAASLPCERIAPCNKKPSVRLRRQSKIPYCPHFHIFIFCGRRSRRAINYMHSLESCFAGRGFHMLP